MKNGQLMASLLWEMVIVCEMRGKEKEEGKDGGN